jgi:type I restriction enzyme S subunit
MRYPTYSAYKEANIEWSSSIPSEWDDTSVKFCFNIQLGKMLQPKPKNINDVEFPYLKALHVNWDNIDTDNLPEMFASKKDIAKYSVSEGDLLVCEGGEVGRAALIKKLIEPAIIQNALHRVRNDELGDVNFFSYMLRNISDAGWFDILCNKATIAHLTGEKLSAIRFPVPPLKEQQIIAKFLDFKSRKIDSLIEKKKALIEKLEEKRIALITQAITKGLDQRVNLKPSGAEFLGDVPEHWVVSNLRHFCKTVSTGTTPSTSNDDNYENPTELWFSPSDFDDRNIELCYSKKKLNKYALDTGAVKTFPKGSVLLIGIGATLGKVGIANREFSCNQQINVIVPEDNLNSYYLVYLLLAQKEMIRVISNASTLGIINQDQTKSIEICIPPLNEQKAIIQYISNEILELNRVQDKNLELINKLKEYRSAIITSAVTGKIDVRDIEIRQDLS